MKKYIFLRVVLILFTLFLIVSLVFLGANISMLAKWSLPHPIIEDIRYSWELYKVFLVDVFTKWEWGKSGIYNLPAWDLIVSKAWVTLKINFAAYIVYMGIGITLGIITAIKKDSIFDKAVGLITLAFGSVPTFITIFALIYIFGYQLFWLDPIYTQVGEGFVEGMLGLIIPVTAIALWPMSHMIRLVRGEVIETLQSEFLLLVRAKGLTRSQSVFRHVVKNIMVTILPEMTNTFIAVVGLSFLVEIVYNVPGIANLMYDAIMYNAGGGSTVYFDIPVVVLLAAFYSAVGLFVALINDVLQPVIDPRINMGAKK